MTDSKSPISREDYAFALQELCNQDTSLDSENWSKDNFLHGHCAVVSLQAQKLFGGTLLRASLENTPYSHMRSHYKNNFTDGELDFTKDQFTEGYPDVTFEHRDRNYALSAKFPKTIERYIELTFRLNDLITDSKNPLFADEIYRRCISNAVISPCKKLGFGAVIVYENKIVAESNNDTIPELERQCNPVCIREGIQSRTESMIGACGHAEEWVMKKANDDGIPLKESSIYIAGLTAYGLPWITQEAVHTCLRCSVQMNYAGLDGVYVPVKNNWERLSTSEALKTAEAFALKEKKV